MMKKLFTLLMVLGVMINNAYAYEFAVENEDGVTIYYNYINHGKELEVTYKSRMPNSYSGNVVIPEEVTFMDNTRKVTAIGEHAFELCSDLISVTIPNSVTSIGMSAFEGCGKLTSVKLSNHLTNIGEFAFKDCLVLNSVNIPQGVISIGILAFYRCTGLTSISIPQSVTYIGENAFDEVTLSSVVSLIENPFVIYGSTSDYRVFNQNTFYNATLYVPAGTIDKYKATEGWKDFAYIEEGTGGGGEEQKCATPTINYQNGKLTFNCETEGASFQYTITDDDIKSGNSDEVQLGVTYNIRVYATKEGFSDSDVATATLCWIDLEPRSEG